MNSNYGLQQQRIARAYELVRLQRYDLALDEVQRALELDSRSAEAHVCAAWILRQSGRLDDAEEAIQRALEFDPMFPAAYNVKACILWSQGRILEAEQSFKTALALQGPDTALYITNYARMQLAVRNPQDALELAGQALSLAPSQSIAHQVRGEALRVLGETDAAIEALQTALRLDPRNALAHNSLGLVQLSLGRVGEAQDSFREALRLQPGEADFQVNLVSSLRAQYPLYGRLLTFALRANTSRGRVYFLWVSVIAFGLLLFLPVMFGLVYGLQTPMTQEAKNLWMLLMVSVFMVWLLAISGWFILRPLFNLLLSLDARNRAVVETDPADVVGVGLLIAAVLSLLAYGMLLVTTGPSQSTTLFALYTGVVSLIALLLSGGMSVRVTPSLFDRARAAQRRLLWAARVSYGVLVVCMYILATEITFDMVPNGVLSWVMILFFVTLCAYGALWVTRVLDAHRVPTRARHATLQWGCGMMGIAFIGLITALSLGFSTYTAFLTALMLAFVGTLATTHRTTRSTRLYQRWVMVHGDTSARNRTVLLFMGACACLAAIALMIRYLPAR